MVHYTLGAFFRDDYKKVLLMEKKTPEWQRDKKSFPGGKIQELESPVYSLVREFSEETGYFVPPEDWIYCGVINARCVYTVDIYAAAFNNHKVLPVTDFHEGYPCWADISRLPENVLPNLRWMIPFCADLHRRRTDNGEQLFEGVFNYKLL